MRPHFDVPGVLVGRSSSAGSGSGSSETFTRANWATVQSDPEAYKGARVDFVGQVFVSPERDAKRT